MNRSKYKQKVIKELAALVDSEEVVLGKYIRYNRILLFSGFLLCIVSLLESFEPHWPLPLIAAIGVAGGLLIGRSITFGSSVVQWPIMKQFINAEAIRKAHRDAELQ